MDLRLAWQHARHVQRVESAQRAVVERSWGAAGMPRPGLRLRLLLLLRRLGVIHPVFLVVPLLVPMFVWFEQRHGGDAWSVAAAVLVLLVGSNVFQSEALAFSPTDVLRHPSKAGVILLRIVRGLPALLWPGVCWAVAYALLLPRVLPAHPWAAAIALTTVSIAPLVSALGVLARRLEGVESSTLVPALLPVFAALVLWRVFSEPSLSAVQILLALVASVLGLAGLAAIVREGTRQPHVLARTLGVELASLPRLLVAVGLALPAAMRFPSGSTVGLVAWIGAPATVLLAVHALRRIVTAVGHAEERTAGAAIHTVEAGEERPDERPFAPRALPTAHRGTPSLLRAQLYLHRRTHLRLDGIASPMDVLFLLPGMVSCCLWHVWGPLLGALAVVAARDLGHATPLALLAGATAPAFVRVRLRHDLHLLGIDYTAQVRHDSRALLWFAAAPTLLAACIAAAVSGWTERTLLVVAAIAGTLALRAGWRGLARTETGRDGTALLAVFVVLVVSPFVPLVAWWTVGLALLAGIAGIRQRLHRREDDLAAELRLQ